MCMTKPVVNKLSVVLATYNEEKNIVRCLEAIKDVADEIIVVDGQSNDKTVVLAKKCGAQVLSVPNTSIFHINKQIAMDAARYALVLQLDADEVVDPELLTFIKKLKCTTLEGDASNSTAAWYIKRKNLFLGKFLTKGGQYPDPVIRLYQNGRARLPQKSVHEQMEVNGATETADGHLIHYSNPDFETYLKKWNSYTSLTASELFKSKQNNFHLAVSSLIMKPIITFVSLYIRHKGFIDGVPGLVFALMSGLHHSVAYLKYREMVYANSH